MAGPESVFNKHPRMAMGNQAVKRDCVVAVQTITDVFHPQRDTQTYTRYDATQEYGMW